MHQPLKPAISTRLAGKNCRAIATSRQIVPPEHNAQPRPRDIGRGRGLDAGLEIPGQDRVKAPKLAGRLKARNRSAGDCPELAEGGSLSHEGAHRGRGAGCRRTGKTFHWKQRRKPRGKRRGSGGRRSVQDGGFGTKAAGFTQAVSETPGIGTAGLRAGLRKRIGGIGAPMPPLQKTDIPTGLTAAPAAGTAGSGWPGKRRKPPPAQGPGWKPVCFARPPGRRP